MGIRPPPPLSWHAQTRTQITEGEGDAQETQAQENQEARLLMAHEHEGMNKGPGAGGTYSNADNDLEIGGETHPTEPEAMNAAQIAYAMMNRQDATLPAPTESVDLAGGNKGSSQMSAPGSTPEGLRGGNVGQKNPSGK